MEVRHVSLLITTTLLAFPGTSLTSAAQPDATSAPQSRAHILVVFPSAAHRPGDAALARALNKFFSQGWLVSVDSKTGNFTPYVSDAQALKSELDAVRALPTLASNPDLVIEQAIDRLAKFPGQRVLLVDTAGSPIKTLPTWVRGIAESHVAAYVVDGGRREQVYYDNSWGYSRGPSPQDYEFAWRRKRFDEDGVFHEVKLPAAVKDILLDGRILRDPASPAR